MIELARSKLDALSDADIAAVEAVADQRVLTELITALGRAAASGPAPR